MTQGAPRVTDGTEGVDTDPGIGPKSAPTAVGPTDASRSSFGTGPADTISKVRTPNVGGLQDLQVGRVQTITLADNAGVDTWTITAYLDGALVGTTAALDDDASSATVQTAIRALLAGTDLTVVTDGDPVPGAAGQYVVTHARNFFSRHFPKYVVTGTGMTGVVANAAVGSNISALGETQYEGTPTVFTAGVPTTPAAPHATELAGPVIGTITVNAGTNEVQTAVVSPGADSGTFRLRFRRAYSAELAFDTGVLEVQAEVDAMFTELFGDSADAPTVDQTVGAEVQTIDLADVAEADTFKIATGAGATAKTATIVVPAIVTGTVLAALIETRLNAVLGAGAVSVSATSGTAYVVTFDEAGDPATLQVTDEVGFTAKADAGYTTGVIVTSARTDGTFTFTFANGEFAGRPIRGGLATYEDEVLDGAVAEPVVITAGTPGVLGNISAAYTEQATVGDSVFAEAFNDVTHKSYGAQNDAASPAAIGSLPPGDYTLVMRTVADGALSPPTTKAFTQTSA